MKNLVLSNGVQIPVLGFGVYQVSKQECESVVLNALSVGYRHIDTAQSYGNEEEVGRAIITSSIPRKDLFLTTKVWIDHYGYEKCKDSVLESLRKLQTSYIDLVLLHQPFGDYYGAWRALEDLYTEGKIKAIGISNFYPDRMVDLCTFARIRPMVNQVETHPFNQQIEAQTWMKKYGMQIESWGPFAEGRNNIFSHPILKAIGDQYHKSVAQVIVRWLIQRDIVVFPKSTHKERMIENFTVFDFTLSESDMNLIATLDQKQSVFFSHQDPATVEMFARFVQERRKNT